MSITADPSITLAGSPAADAAPAVADLDVIVSLAKRRGFVFPSSEIYGGSTPSGITAHSALS